MRSVKYTVIILLTCSVSTLINISSLCAYNAVSLERYLLLYIDVCTCHRVLCEIEVVLIKLLPIWKSKSSSGEFIPCLDEIMNWWCATENIDYIKIVLLVWSFLDQVRQGWRCYPVLHSAGSWGQWATSEPVCCRGDQWTGVYPRKTGPRGERNVHCEDTTQHLLPQSTKHMIIHRQ